MKLSSCIYFRDFIALPFTFRSGTECLLGEVGTGSPHISIHLGLLVIFLNILPFHAIGSAVPVHVVHCQQYVEMQLVFCIDIVLCNLAEFTSSRFSSWLPYIHPYTRPCHLQTVFLLPSCFQMTFHCSCLEVMSRVSMQC